MKTVKEVSDLTRISVRMLHYYDKVGLLKPSKITNAGYRLYDEEALMTLQQILFYKELDIPLKEVKEIMYRPDFNKIQALEKQKKLLILKRDRLNNLVELINKTIKGESVMSFKEFDMSEYFNALEELKNQQEDKIRSAFGSIEKYDEFVEKCKLKETEIAKMAVKKYGSIEKYVTAMKKNFNSDFFKIGEQSDQFRKDLLEDNDPQISALFKIITNDLNLDPTSEEIQRIAEEITDTVKNIYDIFKMDRGTDCWYYIVQSFLMIPDWIKKVDDKYGEGAAKFIGQALKYFIRDNQPKLENLYEKLTSNLKEDPFSVQIQEIVKEIAVTTKKNQETLKIDDGENHLGYMADLYLSDSIWSKAIDKKYGEGAAKFIGQALKYYVEGTV